MSSTRSISAGVIGFGVGEVEAQAVGCDQRALLGDVIAEHLAQRLVQEVGRRVVLADGAAASMIDLERQRRANLERALIDRAGMHEQVACLLLRLGDAERDPLAAHHAGIADLAAGLAVERRLVQDHSAGLALLEGLDLLAVLDQRRDHAFGALGSRSPGTRWRPAFSRRANHTASVAASPEPDHDARAFSFCFSIAALKPSVSTAMPRGLSASCVRSRGKP
jgi:hypothetical protein